MNFNDFRNQVLTDSSSDGTWVYRGHASREWSLRSSYARLLERLSLRNDFSLDLFTGMFEDFLARASALTGARFSEFSLTQQLALAQHHGLPSPLLDWSHSPYIAAFFAASDTALDAHNLLEINVFALDVTNFPNTNAEIDLMSKDKPLHFIDTREFPWRRVAAQQGCFTLQSFGESLQVWKEERNPRLNIKTYKIDDHRENVLRELELMGITGGNLFDDLDHIASDIVRAKRVWRA